MNEKTLAKIRKKKHTFDRYLKTREGKDYLENVKARNQAKGECHKAVMNNERGIAKLSIRDPKLFYKYVNSKLKTNPWVADLEHEDGSLADSNSDQADLLKKTQ